jgi:hypothetical protein
MKKNNIQASLKHLKSYNTNSGCVCVYSGTESWLPADYITCLQWVKHLEVAKPCAKGYRKLRIKFNESYLSHEL